MTISCLVHIFSLSPLKTPKHGVSWHLVPMCLSEHGCHVCVFCGWVRKNIHLRSVFIFILIKCYIYISSKRSISLKNHILFFSTTQVTKAYLTSIWLSPGESVSQLQTLKYMTESLLEHYDAWKLLYPVYFSVVYF